MIAENGAEVVEGHRSARRGLAPTFLALVLDVWSRRGETALWFESTTSRRDDHGEPPGTRAAIKGCEARGLIVWTLERRDLPRAGYRHRIALTPAGLAVVGAYARGFDRGLPEP